MTNDALSCASEALSIYSKRPIPMKHTCCVYRIYPSAPLKSVGSPSGFDGEATFTDVARAHSVLPGSPLGAVQLECPIVPEEGSLE